nr:hypothetical protein [Rhizobium leguminosarum]
MGCTATKYVTRELEWRKPISSLNCLLTSHVWREDRNGFDRMRGV